jgi:phytoene/squalene synthetase
MSCADSRLGGRICHRRDPDGVLEAKAMQHNLDEGLMRAMGFKNPIRLLDGHIKADGYEYLEHMSQFSYEAKDKYASELDERVKEMIS